MSKASRNNPLRRSSSSSLVNQPSLFDLPAAALSIPPGQADIGPKHGVQGDFNGADTTPQSYLPHVSAKIETELASASLRDPDMGFAGGTGFGADVQLRCSQNGMEGLIPRSRKTSMDNNVNEQQLIAGARRLATVTRRGRKPIYADLPLNFTDGAAEITRTDLPRHVYFRIVNDSEVGDRHPLRVLWKVAEHEGVNIVNLHLTHANLAELLAKHRLHHNPTRYARQILICLGRLIEVHPGLLTQSYEPVIDTRIHPIPECDMPDRLVYDIRMWVDMTPIKLDGKPNPVNALALATIDSYVSSQGTILAALQLAGLRLDPTVDVAFLMQRLAVARWLPVLKKWSARGTVRGHLAAMLRIGADLPGQSQTDIENLRARLAEIMDDLVLDADQLAMLAAWTEPERHACLLSAPDRLMRSAEDTSSTFQTRMLAGASAFAFQLMWEHPGLSERAIAEFDTDVHVVGDPGEHSVLRCHPASGMQAAAWVPERMSPEAERLLERLLTARLSMSITGTLLLPGTDGRPREVRAAMEVIYNKIQGLLSERIKSSNFRDINAYIALDDKEADLPEIAAGLGYSDARSLERRFGPHAQRGHGRARS